MLGARRSYLVLAAVAAAALPASAAAATGDLYVADYASSPGAAFRIDPGTGTATQVAARDTPGDAPFGIAFAPSGSLLLSDRNTPGGPTFAGALFSIDLATGAKQPIVFGGPPFEDPRGIAIAPDGSVLVADADSPGPGAADGAILRVDMKTGSVTTISASADFEDPADAVAAPNGEIYMVDFESATNGAVLRLDASGVPTPVFTNPSNTRRPVSLERMPDGDLLILLAGVTDAVLRLDLATGQLTTVAEGAPMDEAQGIAAAPDGSIYIADERVGGAVLRVAPDTGVVSTVLSGPPLDQPSAVTVEPPRCGGRLATIVGSTGPDRLVGSPFADVIAGLGGKDRIKGGKGKDRICGGKGRDRLIGGKGTDRCAGGKGADIGKSCERGKL